MRLLAVNAGSSSLKLALRETDRALSLCEMEARGIGAGGEGSLAVDGAVVKAAAFADHSAALAALLEHLPRAHGIERIGHRIVHGGERHRGTAWIDETLLRDLEKLAPLSPLHLPPAVAVARACSREFPGVPQAAVFDTAFHATLPDVAAVYAVPAAWRAAGVRRYGFHGIACANLVAQLGDELRPRAVILHLGAGCSATAVRDGRSIDTTMGFTPLEGLMMGTRSGDIDPGAVLHMQREHGLSPDDIEHALTARSGLLGLSELSGHMGELLAHAEEPRVRLAIEVFCYRAAKSAGALAVALGGLDQLIFSGGIGEHAAPVRARIIAHLSCFGAALDEEANARHAAVISSGKSAVSVRVVRVDESREIARETGALRALR